MSIQELVRGIAGNGSLLVQRQVKLLELESRRDLAREASRLMMIGAAALIGCVGLTVLSAALVIGLGAALGGVYWACALGTGALLSMGALLLATLAVRKHRPEPLKASRRELEEELSWAKPQTT